MGAFFAQSDLCQFNVIYIILCNLSLNYINLCRNISPYESHGPHIGSMGMGPMGSMGSMGAMGPMGSWAHGTHRVRYFYIDLGKLR